MNPESNCGIRRASVKITMRYCFRLIIVTLTGHFQSSLSHKMSSSLNLGSSQFRSNEKFDFCYRRETRRLTWVMGK